MTEEERQFHITEGRECVNADIYASLFGYEDAGLFFYMDGPTEVLRYMGWPKCEGQDFPSTNAQRALA